MNLIFLAAIFFVVIFAVIVQLIVKCPYIPAAIVALISLIVYAVLAETLGTIFIAWIIIYTLTALLAAYLTCLFYRNRECGSCDCNNCRRCGTNNCQSCGTNDNCNSCNCNDF